MAAISLDHRADASHDAWTITVTENGTTTTVGVCGEWDLATQPAARTAIGSALDRRPECIVLDLSQLTFIDSSGLHAVLALHTRCAQQKIHFVIIRGSSTVQRPFELCGLTDRLPFLGATA